MKIFIVAILALLAVAAQPASARQWRDHSGPRFDVQAQQQRQRPGGYQQHQQPQREFRRPERDYRGPERDYRGPERQPERRHDGRMTDEERGNLRRDLDRANREIYRGR